VSCDRVYTITVHVRGHRVLIRKHRIKLTTTAPESKTYDGILYTADPITSLVVINVRASLANSSSDGASQPGDYRIIPISRIQSFQIVSLASGNDVSESGIAAAKPNVTEVDVKRLERRVTDRVQALKEQEKSRGKGVTKEAQAIFDAFQRMCVRIRLSIVRVMLTLNSYSNMQIRWHNQEMIVSDVVIIPPPYRVENCRGAKDKQEVVNRVKKVLEGERRKLQDKENLERKSATPTGSRKGG
jgi:protein LSM12